MTEHSISNPSRSCKLKDLCVLLGLWAAVVLQYGALVYLTLILPIFKLWVARLSVQSELDWPSVFAVLLLFMMLAIGQWTMGEALKRIFNRMAVQRWIPFAAALSLPSAFGHFLLGSYLDALRLDTTYPIINLTSIYVYLASTTMGFYMPFVLSTYWVKYRYRESGL